MNALLLTSNDGTQVGHSGYDRLAAFITGARRITVPRRTPHGFFGRCVRKLRETRGVSSWCMPSSWEMESLAARALDEAPADVLHMLWADRDWYRADVLAASHGCAFVATVHACPIDLPHVFPGRSRQRLSSADAIILMSTHQKPFFIEAGVPENRLHVVLHGIDADFYTPAPWTDDAAKPFRVLFVGQTRRDFDTLDRVARNLAGMDGFELVIISHPSFKSRYTGIANTHFLHGVPEDELRAQYQQADVLLMPLLDCTANNAVLEAFASGVPVVADKVGGMADYVTDDCAILVDHGDAAAMTDALQALRSDRARLRRLSQGARARAEALSWKNQARAVMDVYASAAAREPMGAPAR